MWNETPPKNSNIYRLGHCCVFPFTKWYAGACLIVRHRVAIVSERRNHSERLQCSLNLIPSRSTNKIKQRTNSTSNARNVSQESLENQNQLRSTAKNYQRRSNFENQKTAQNFCSRICGQHQQKKRCDSQRFGDSDGPIAADTVSKDAVRWQSFDSRRTAERTDLKTKLTSSKKVWRKYTFENQEYMPSFNEKAVLISDENPQNLSDVFDINAKNRKWKSDDTTCKKLQCVIEIKSRKDRPKNSRSQHAMHRHTEWTKTKRKLGNRKRSTICRFEIYNLELQIWIYPLIIQ
jgi:hypothetical protein